MDAMENALKFRVLFLVHGDEDIEALTHRTKRLTMQALCKTEGLGAKVAQRLFTESGNDWILKPSLEEGSGGWLFFYPVELLQANEDAGNPLCVYWPNASMAYARVPYDEWRRLRAEGYVWRPDPNKIAKGPRSQWDRLLELEPEDE
jgi:hypothetical protein